MTAEELASPMFFTFIAAILVCPIVLFLMGKKALLWSIVGLMALAIANAAIALSLEEFGSTGLVLTMILTAFAAAAVTLGYGLHRLRTASPGQDLVHRKEDA